MGKIFTLILVLLVLIVSVTSNTSAIGISPSTREVQYKESGTDTKLTYHIVNNELRDYAVKIYAEGPLKQYLIPEETTVEIREEEHLKQVYFDLNLPPNLTLTNTQTIKIIAEQISEKGNVLGTNILAISRLVANLHIMPLAPETSTEKMLEVETAIKKSEKDDIVNITLKFKNAGSVTIEDATGIVEIRDATGNRMYETSTESVTLRPDEEKNLTVQIYSQRLNLQNGEYSIFTTITYDNLKKALNETFSIGQPSIYIESITGQVISGTIKLNTTIKSEWNGFLKGTTADFIITDAAGKIVKETSPPEITITPFQKSTLTVFLENTKPAEAYTLKVLINYAQKTTKKEIPLANLLEITSPKKEHNPLLIITITLAATALSLIILAAYLFILRRKN